MLSQTEKRNKQNPYNLICDVKQLLLSLLERIALRIYKIAYFSPNGLDLQDYFFFFKGKHLLRNLAKLGMFFIPRYYFRGALGYLSQLSVCLLLKSLSRVLGLGPMAGWLLGLTPLSCTCSCSLFLNYSVFSPSGGSSLSQIEKYPPPLEVSKFFGEKV